MPTFDTPAPIDVTIEIPAGQVTLTAGDRADTVVEVRPSRSSSKSDAQAAERTRIEYAQGHLLVRAEKQSGWTGRGGSVDVRIALPAGSDVRLDTAAGDVRIDGRVGECSVTTASGDVRLDRTGPVRLHTGSGDVAVHRVDGNAQVTAVSGDVRIGEIDGAAVIRNASGSSWVGEISGDLRLNAANGDISVGRSHAGLTARTASGDVRVDEVVRGSVVLDAASGDLEVGIRPGTAAWLDVSSLSGSVRSSLEASDGPDESDETAEVRARTLSGDVLIRRS